MKGRGQKGSLRCKASERKLKVAEVAGRCGGVGRTDGDVLRVDASVQ